jgi:hypothetical protein
MTPMEELAAAVKAHALANWGKDGWDWVYECFEYSDYVEEIGGAKTVAGAIRNVKKYAVLRQEQAEEIQASTEW